MAESSGFFEAKWDDTIDNGDGTFGNWDRRYLADNFADYFKNFIGNGVFVNPTNQLKVSTSSGMNVQVSTGWAFIKGYWYHNDENKIITIPSNSGSTSRTDTIKARLNLNTRVITVDLYVNNNSVVRNDTYYDMILAQIVVPAYATTIPAANITDKRPDEAVCGFVKGLVEVITTDDLFDQFQAIFDEWFDGVKDQVTGDLAIRLQLEFTQLNSNVDTYYQNTNNNIAAYKTQMQNIVDTYQAAVEQQVDAAEDLVDGYVYNDYITDELTFNFLNNVCEISDSRVTPNSLLDLYFTKETIDEAENCQINIESGVQKYIITCVKTPSMSLRGRIRVRVNSATPVVPPELDEFASKTWVNANFLNKEEGMVETVEDSEPYVLRQGLGDMADIELVGGSVAWNQLVQNGNFASTSNWVTSSGNTFTVSNNVATFKASAQYQSVNQALSKTCAGHKIFFTATVKSYTSDTNKTLIIIRLFTSISPATYTDVVTSLSTTETKYQKLLSIPSNIVRVSVLFQDNATSNWGNITIKNVNTVDLTQAFGTTIADYIYNLEQANSGSGVAFFRKYFPNAYYAYNGGSIQSVCVSERKVRGFNLHDEIYELGMIDSSTGQPAPANATYRTKNFCKVIPSTQYYVYCDASVQYPLRIFRYDANKNYIDSDTYRNALMTVDSNVHYLKFHFNIADLGKNFCINISNTSKNGQYEPYKIATYPLPNTELQGILTLVDNKLKYDGDTLESNGKITRKYGIVNLGSLTWTYVSGNPSYFHANLVDNKVGATGTYGKILSGNGYEVLQTKGSTAETMSKDKGIALQNSSHLVIVRDSAYTDATTFKTAMNGVYLVYELATPTTEDTTPFQNPQKSIVEGTEEFIDGLTRDVMIPVGHNTIYSISDILSYGEDYVEGVVNLLIPISAFGTNESKRSVASKAYSQGDYFFKDGFVCKAKTSISKGATFTLNTNYEKKLLADILKALES